MATDLLGDRVDIGEEIGRGAMGVVHRADMNGRAVVVKILHPHLNADLTAVGRFVREHQVLGRISHPNVVKVVDLIIDDPRIGIVMEYLDAIDLSKLMAGERLEPARAVAMGADIAAGVAAIHKSGVVHRDLKPANILVVDGDHPKITDFGVSRLTGQSSSKATTTLGTPLYMSPEAADGGGAIDAPADVYSLGVILFEMLTGETPFNGDEPIAIAVAHVGTPPPTVGGVPAELNGLIDSMLAKDAAVRPTAAEVEERLRAVVHDIGPDTAPVAVARTATGPDGNGRRPVIDLTDKASDRGRFPKASTELIDTVAAGPPRSDETVIANGMNGVGNAVTAENRNRIPDRTTASGVAPAPQGRPAPEIESASTVGSPGVPSPPVPAPTPRSVLHEPTGRDLQYPPVTSSKDRPNRESGLTLDGRAFIGLIVLATVIVGVFAIAAFRPNGWLADDVSTTAPDDIAYSFAPRLSANGLITTRRWEYDPLTNEVEVEVGLTNTSSQAGSGNHYEVLPPTLVDAGQGPVDFDAIADSFQPSPTEFSTDPLVATIGYDDLEPGRGLTVTYRFPVPVGIGAQSDLEQLAIAQQEAEAEFLAGLPIREEEANASEAVLAELGVEPARIRLEAGETMQVEVTGVLSDGTPLDPQALESAVLMVEDAAVAAVEGTTIRAVAPGRTVLTVTMGDVSARSTIAVSRPSGDLSELAGPSTTRRMATSSTNSTTRSTTSTTRSTSSSTTSAPTTTPTTRATTSLPVTTATTVTTTTSTTQPTTTTSEPTTTEGEATLTMSPLSASVRDDGSFKITFSTNLCTIANYQGAGQSYITPGWPEVTGTCWQNHGQNFTPVEPGEYTIVVRSRSAGGQEAQRSIAVTVE
jgi:serine/threonine-protein kinase